MIASRSGSGRPKRCRSSVLQLDQPLAELLRVVRLRLRALLLGRSSYSSAVVVGLFGHPRTGRADFFNCYNISCTDADRSQISS